MDRFIGKLPGIGHIAYFGDLTLVAIIEVDHASLALLFQERERLFTDLVEFGIRCASGL